jgi:hypothetical protein
VATLKGKTYYQNSIISQNHTTSLDIPKQKNSRTILKLVEETIENQLFTKE